MPKQIRLYDRITENPSWGDSGNKLVNAVWVGDGTNLSWKSVDVGWVYEPSFGTMTGWTVVFGTLTPTVSITDYSTTPSSVTLNWDSEYQEYIVISYYRTDNPSQVFTTTEVYTQLKTYTITNNISPGNYVFTLRVYSETDTMAQDSENVAIPIIPTVSNFVLVSKTFNSATLSWQSTNQSTYRIILYYPSGDGTGQINTGEISSTSARSYSFSNLDPSTEYTPQIIIKSSTGNTASLTGTPFITDPPPAPVNTVLPTTTGFRIVGYTQQVTSNGTWTGTGTLFYAYQWVRSLNNSTWSEIPGAFSSSYTLSNSDIGYYVTCRVGARLFVGSTFSDWAYAFANSPGTVGSSPTATLHSIDQITSSSARYTFSTSGATTIYARASPEFGPDVDSPSPISSPYVLTGLASGTSYFGYIIASNEFNLVNSNGISFTTLIPLPPAPTGLQAYTLNQSQVYLVWNDISGFNLSSPYYRIQYSTDNSTWTTLNGTASSNFTVTGLSAGTLYYFRVAAVNPTGTGPYSSSVTATTYPPNPGAFSLSVSGVGQNSATFSWTNSSYATEYVLFVTDVIAESGPTYYNVSSPYTVTGLSPGRNYEAQVAAINYAGGIMQVTNSNFVSFTTGSPAPPFFQSPFFPFFQAPFFPFFPDFESPFFPFFPPDVSNDSLGADTYVLTTNGYVQAKYLEVGDRLVSLDISEVPIDGTKFNLGDWSSEEFTNNGLVETEIVSIVTNTKDRMLYQLNGDWFTANHSILVRKDGIHMFKRIDELDTSYQVFDYELMDWTDIDTLESVESTNSAVYRIDCEPYDIFFTQNALVYNVVEYEDE